MSLVHCHYIARVHCLCVTIWFIHSSSCPLLSDLPFGGPPGNGKSVSVCHTNKPGPFLGL